MARVTQTEAYWRDEYTVTPEDEAALLDFFLEQGKPLTLKTIANFLLRRRVEDESPSAEGSGTYAPTDHFEVGTRLIFPQLEGAIGEVVAVRPGENERYGEFEVIRVRLHGQKEEREFATGLSNFRLRSTIAELQPRRSAQELFEEYGGYVMEAAEYGLETSGSFAAFGPHWLPTAMLVPFHEGHFNIAEAMIDVVGSPLSPDELLTELPVQDGATSGMKRFSLNYALSRQKNFVNIGTAIDPKWQLRDRN